MTITIDRNVALSPAQAKASYHWTGQYRNGKPVFRIPTKRALTRKSPFAHKELCDRIILGLSTGTIEDDLAGCFEARTSSPTARLRTLHWRQDQGFRTFGMIGPSLPHEDYNAFESADRSPNHRGSPVDSGTNPLSWEKLRFLQYVQSGSEAWWQAWSHPGAILLGQRAGRRVAIPK